MFGVLAAEIHLMPDWTLLVQVGIFLLVLVVLYFLVFRPTLRVIDQRKKFTSEARMQSEQLHAEADRLDAERQAAITQAIREASVIREQREVAAHRDAEQRIAEARQEARARIDSTEISLERSEEAAAADIAAAADALAREIAQRVTRKPEGRRS